MNTRHRTTEKSGEGYPRPENRSAIEPNSASQIRAWLVAAAFIIFLLGINVQRAAAAPMFIIESARCVKDTVVNGVASTKIELDLNYTTAVFYNYSIHLYYTPTGSNTPWQTNGIPIFTLDNDIAEFILPFQLTTDLDLYISDVALSPYSNPSGSWGSGPHGSTIVLHPCAGTPSTGSICGRKIWDVNCNGVEDSSDVGLPGWVITLSPNNIQTTTDARGNFCFDGLAVGIDYHVAEVAQDGWSQTIPQSRDYRVVLSSTQSPRALVFGNCRRTVPVPECGPECNLVVNGNFSGGNTSFTSALPYLCGSCTAGSYCVGPTFQTKCSSWPAGFDHTVGTASGRFLSIDGSTAAASDVWRQDVNVISGLTYTFSFWGKNVYTGSGRAVDVEMRVGSAVIAIPSVASNTAWVRYTASWTAGMTGPVSISLRQRTADPYRDFGIDDIFFGTCPCPCMPRCDSLKVTPFSFPDLSQNGKKFTLFNRRSPMDPITKVQISLSPAPVSGPLQWTGGTTVVVDGVPRPWNVLQSGTPYYSLIALDCPGATGAPQGAAAAGDVSFNLGVISTLNWSGVVTVKTIHCDGDTCINTYDWCAKTNPRECPVESLSSSPIRIDSIGRLLANRILVRGNDRVNIAFAMITPDRASGAEIFATGVGRLRGGDINPGLPFPNDNSIARILSGDSLPKYGALIEFGGGISPDGTAEIPLVLELPGESLVNAIKVYIRLYNVNGDMISLDSTMVDATVGVNDVVTGSIAGSSAMLHNPEPTPTTGDLRLGYWLQAAEIIRLELFDVVGTRVAEIESGRREAGDHIVRYSAAALPNGTYMVRLTTSVGIMTRTVIVQR